jgi:hypothetical protein
MTLSPHPLRIARAALLCAALLAAALGQASGMGFTSGLSAPERDAAGLTRLSSAQAAVLDALVDRDVTLAHEGGVTGFSAGFLERHSAAERDAAGIGPLNDAERQQLDRLAARAIAIGPPPDAGFRYAPPPTPAPKAAAPATDVVLSEKLQVHGDVSVTVGGGAHGQSFYGTSADVFVTDPSHGFTVGVGFSEFRGKGLLELCGPYGPLSPYAPLAQGPPYPGW